MKRTKEEAAQTRQAVLDAALDVFSRKGYAKTSLGEVASEAGVTRGAVYWHFKNKYEMFNAVHEFVDRKAEVRIDSIKESDITPTEKIKQLMSELFKLLASEPEYRIVEELALFRFEKDSQLYEMYQHQLDDIKQMVETFKVILKQGIETGELNPDLNIEITVTAIVSYIAGMRSTWLSAVRTIPIAENAEILAATFVNGLVKR